MEKNKTPKPDSSAYDVEKTEDLNVPKFNSTTQKRTAADLPADENMNNQSGEPKDVHDDRLPDTNLGNSRDDDEAEKEKIIRT